MKYSEFIQLYELLEGPEKSAPTTATKDSVTDTESSEPKELETKRGEIFTRYGRLKMRLNKVGKATQKQLMDNVLNKYFPQILNVEKEILEKIRASKETDKSKLRQLVNTNYSAIKKQQDNQVNLIETAINKFLENVTQKMNNKIDKSKAWTSNKLILKNYWNLLVTQIAMNSSLYMVKEREKILDAIFADDKEAAEAAKKSLQQREIAEKRRQAAEKKKSEVKAEEAKLKAEEAQPEEEKETPTAATATQTAQKEEPKEKPETAPVAQKPAPAVKPTTK